MQQDLSQALSQHFGYGAFRKGQEAVVRSVLSGRPTIAILPTGGGKSLCYQLPALLLEGTTVVVSPLVALMKDQVDALRARGIAATFVNSSLSDQERNERQAAIRRGQVKLLYVAPERFRSASFLSAMQGIHVPLLAVDEAHCISAWGHDFRPEYQKIAQARAALGAERILALTATATPEVRRDIAEALELKDPRVFVAGFDRPNLFIEVLRVAGDKDKLGRLAAILRNGEPGLVYAATRKNVEKVVSSLRGAGVAALGYHAGMGDEERTSVQDRFVRGDAPVVVATNAFGMGVDKADIRLVAHFDAPRSLEGYYQEIGRAGRDGKPSHALLLFNFADIMMQRRMIEAGRPSRDLVAQAWEAARELRQGSIDQLARACSVNASEVQSAVRLLESAGHLERGRGRDSQFSVATPAVSAADLAVDFELLETRALRERQMLDRLVRFADTRGCRRQNLLKYFGDLEAPSSCNACESCAGSRAPEAVAVKEPRRAKAAAAATPPPQEGDYDAAVYEQLRALRTAIAKEQAVPPYVVFHDATLKELARALPRDQTSFLAVKGAGPSRWERYGERVVAITSAARPAAAPAGARPAAAPAAAQPGVPAREPVASRPAAGSSPSVSEPGASYGPPRGRGPLPLREEPPPPAQEPGGTNHPAGPARDSLWALCAGGATLEQICVELRLPAMEVASQLADGVRAGRKFDVQKLLGAERVEAIRAAARGAGGDVVAVRKRLPFPAALAEIRLALSGT